MRSDARPRFLLLLLAPLVACQSRPQAISIEIDDSTRELRLGARRAYPVRGTLPNGKIGYLGEVTWSSSAPQIAAPDEYGQIVAHAAGTATIVATVEGVSAEATLTVTPELTTWERATCERWRSQLEAIEQSATPCFAPGVVFNSPVCLSHEQAVEEAYDAYIACVVADRACGPENSVHREKLAALGQCISQQHVGDLRCDVPRAELREGCVHYAASICAGIDAAPCTRLAKDS